MKYLVRIKLGKELEWPEQEVEADEKWDALVQVAERLGLADKVTMSKLWKNASIKKKEGKRVRIWRTVD